MDLSAPCHIMAIVHFPCINLSSNFNISEYGMHNILQQQVPQFKDVLCRKKCPSIFFQNFFGLFCWRPTAPHTMRRNEKSFLFSFSIRNLVYTFRHCHCLPVCFFMSFYISGEPNLYIDFKRSEQWLITFPDMFSICSLIISKTLCTF